jgi:hypothetical protein
MNGGSYSGSGGQSYGQSPDLFFTDPVTGEHTWYSDYTTLLSKFTILPANPKDMTWISGNKVQMKIVLGVEGPAVTIYDKNPANFSGAGNPFPDLNLCLKLGDASKFFDRLDKESENQFAEKHREAATESHGSNITRRAYGFIYKNHLHMFRVAYETVISEGTDIKQQIPVQIWMIIEDAPDFRPFDNDVIAYFCKLISSE